MNPSLSQETGYVDLPQLITLQQAAERLGVCRRTLEREIAHGRFPRPLKIGSATRVELAAVARYVASLRSQPAKS